MNLPVTRSSCKVAQWGIILSELKRTNALEQRLIVKLSANTAAFAVEIHLELMPFQANLTGSPLLSLFHTQIHALDSFKEEH